MWTWLTRWARARDTPRSRNGGPGTSGSGTRRRCAMRWVTRNSRSTTTPSWWPRRSGSWSPKRGQAPWEVAHREPCATSHAGANGSCAAAGAGRCQAQLGEQFHLVEEQVEARDLALVELVDAAEGRVHS